MNRRTLLGMFLGAAALSTTSSLPAQSGGSIVFVARRPPRDLVGNIRGWAGSNQVRSYAEDVQSQSWRVQFMAFLARPPRAAEVTLVFYKLEGRTRRYITNQAISLSNPNDQVFFHQTVLHRSPDEFQPMENYEVAITVNDSRGASEIARGRVGLVGRPDRHDGVVDFTGAAPVVR
jgi:hypothetical protein